MRLKMGMVVAVVVVESVIVIKVEASHTRAS